MAVSSRTTRTGALLTSVWERLLDLIYPSIRCPLCGGPAGEACDAGICPACLGSVLSHPPAAVATRVPAAVGGVACAMHEDVIASAIRRLKYGPDEAIGEPLGRLLAARVAMASAAGMAVDAVVPVPLHRRRLLERGFNQADILAGYVARRLGVPLRPACLRRLRRTETQAGLGRAARLRNMRDAFHSDIQVSGMRVLVVDDVVTTGATIQACVEALCDARAVAFAAIASAPD